MTSSELPLQCYFHFAINDCYYTLIYLFHQLLSWSLSVLLPLKFTYYDSYKVCIMPHQKTNLFIFLLFRCFHVIRVSCNFLRASSFEAFFSHKIFWNRLQHKISKPSSSLFFCLLLFFHVSCTDTPYKTSNKRVPCYNTDVDVSNLFNMLKPSLALPILRLMSSVFLLSSVILIRRLYQALKCSRQ